MLPGTAFPVLSGCTVDRLLLLIFFLLPLSVMLPILFLSCNYTCRNCPQQCQSDALLGKNHWQYCASSNAVHPLLVTNLSDNFVLLFFP